MNLTGVNIQGHPSKEEWVEKFTVSWSTDGNTWSQIMEKDSNWAKVSIPLGLKLQSN